MKSYLRVKIKSLAEEARIIRTEERRLLNRAARARDRQGLEDRLAAMDTERNGLYLHRVKDVRGEARAAHLAYAFVRGRPYAVVEPSGSSAVPFNRVADLIAKYGYIARATATDKLKAWLKGEQLE